MTIHAAKGLEFPVVLIADMGREFRGFESKIILAEPGGGYGLMIPHPEEPDEAMLKPWSWQCVDAYSRRKALEERKRLLYVAMTRAKQRLILSGIDKPEKGEKEAFPDMACWMGWLMAAELPDVPVRRAGPLQPRRRPLALAERKSGLSMFAKLEPVAPEKLIPDATARESVQKEADRIWARLHDERPPQPSRVIDLPVSAFASYQQSPGQYAQVYEMGYREKTMEEPLEAAPAAEEEAMDQATFGTAMHSLLERLDFHDPARHRQALLDTCFAAFPEPRRREAAGILEQFLASELFHELAKARVIRREIPFLLNERHGILHGVIDVLFQDTRGRWHILDYKTAVGDENKLEKSGYQVQIVLYAHAVQEILKVAPHSGILYFLKNGWSHREALGPEKMREIAAQVKQWQEEILNFRNQFYKKI
jgi:ATP-dependent helicase/nuclease subunit A